jgi:hypothetical protein
VVAVDTVKVVEVELEVIEPLDTDQVHLEEQH